MGGANNICSDKTGTLTKNEMTVTKFYNGIDHDIDPVLKSYNYSNFEFGENFSVMLTEGLICNSMADCTEGLATDIALMRYIVKFGADIAGTRKKKLGDKYTRFHFTSKRKKMSTVVKGSVSGDSPSIPDRLYMKGAPEYVMSSCDNMLISNVYIYIYICVCVYIYIYICVCIYIYRVLWYQLRT